MHWILAHWELVLPLVAAAVVLLFDVVQKMRQTEAVPLRAYLTVVLLLIASISLTMIAQDRPMIPHFAAYLKIDYEGNAYVEDLIESALGDLHESLQNRVSRHSLSEKHSGKSFEHGTGVEEREFR